MSRVCEKWSLEDICEMTDEDMNELLKYYEPSEVPSLAELRRGYQEGFDGSFGWWI